MMRRLYSLALVLLSPVLLTWMAWRAHRAGGRWQVLAAQRFGWRLPPPTAAPPRIWVHAVSLGETRAAQPLIRALLDRGHPVLLTHMTATGWAEGQRTYASDIAAARLQQAWLPYDFAGGMRRFLRHYRPAVAVLMERELWPNLVHAAVAARTPLVLASARMSAASLQRTLRWQRLLRPAYRAVTITYAQSPADADRLRQAGTDPVQVAGNFKFDLQLNDAQVARGRHFAARLGRPVIAVASTREGEDAAFIAAIRACLTGLDPAPLFFLIPRHPQRFDEAAQQLEAAGLRWIRRSALPEADEAGDAALAQCRRSAVLLGDTLGEMPWYYAASTVAIVGGSFAPLGGQNFIEASALGRPVLVGPHTANFAQAVESARDAGALVVADDPADAVHRALCWVADDRQARGVGEAGRVWVAQHTGAVARVLAGIESLLEQARTTWPMP